MKYITEFEGYEVSECVNGMEVYTSDGRFLTTLQKSLSDFEDEDGHVDDIQLEAAIEESANIEDFLVNQDHSLN